MAKKTTAKKVTKKTTKAKRKPGRPMGSRNKTIK